MPSKARNYSLVFCLFVFLFVIIGGGLHQISHGFVDRILHLKRYVVGAGDEADNRGGGRSGGGIARVGVKQLTRRRCPLLNCESILWGIEAGD